MSPPDLKRLRELATKATPGEWHSRRDGVKYIGTAYLPTARLVGASVIPQLQRPWNPYSALARGETAADHEVSRFSDDDADFIAACSPDVILELIDMAEGKK